MDALGPEDEALIAELERRVRQRVGRRALLGDGARVVLAAAAISAVVVPRSALAQAGSPGGGDMGHTHDHTH